MSDGILSLISRLGAGESALLSGTFVAPVHGNEVVAASVHGIAYTFHIKGKPDPGWYKFRPVDSKRARVDGPADIQDTIGYLERLPKVRVVLISRLKGVYQGVAVRDGSHPLSHEQSVPVYLVDDFSNDFDKAICRWDGFNLWYEAVDPVNDPAKGAYLRERFNKLSDPKGLKFKGLTFEEKAAYTVRFAIDVKAREELKTRSIKDDVEHAGGVFVGLREKSDIFEVTYQVDNQTYTSFVSKDAGHAVVSAGICLSGNDRTFDLKSLVTVMREGQRQRRVVRGHGNFGYGLGGDDEDW